MPKLISKLSDKNAILHLERYESWGIEMSVCLLIITSQFKWMFVYISSVFYNKITWMNVPYDQNWNKITKHVGYT